MRRHRPGTSARYSPQSAFAYQAPSGYIEHCSSIGIAEMNNVQEESLRDAKKNRRRHLMLDTARHIIASKGLISLKVRDVAEAADCSIGSVYNEFGDFDGLILTINRETIERLTAKMRAVHDEDPHVQLQGLAAGYLAFAASHTNLLRSLFEHRME